MASSPNKPDLCVLGWPASQNKALNPYNWLLYSAVQKLNICVLEFSPQNILFGHYDILHIHWPEGYLSQKCTISALSKTFIVILLVSIAKLRKAKVLWTIHNLAPHNEYHPLLTKIFWFMFPNLLDGYISLSQYSHQLAGAKYPSLRRKKELVLQFGNGDYQNAYPNMITKKDARKRLGIPQNAFVFSFIGNITPYKNVLQLIECFHNLEGEENILLIAGKPDNAATDSQLQSLTHKDPRIYSFLQFIPADELQIFINSADLLVFPFQDILNSGSVVLSLSFNRPVLIPHMGSLVDLQRIIGTNWVQTYRDKFSSVQLSKAKDLAKALDHQEVDLEVLSWGKIAGKTVEFYKELLR